MADIPKYRTGVYRAHGMGPKQKARYHTEVAAPTAERPEQILILVLARSDETAVGKNDVCFYEVVDSQTVAAAQIARSATQSEASYACGRNDPGGHCETELVGRVIHVTLRTARFNTNGSRFRLDPYPLHQS